MIKRIKRIIEAIHFRIFIALIGFQLRRELAKIERMIEDDK